MHYLGVKELGYQSSLELSTEEQITGRARFSPLWAQVLLSPNDGVGLI